MQVVRECQEQENLLMDIFEAGAKGAAAAVVALLIWFAWRVLLWVVGVLKRAPYLVGRASAKAEDAFGRAVKEFKTGRGGREP